MKYSFQEIIDLVEKSGLPFAEILDDFEGQIVIYTGLYPNPDDTAPEEYSAAFAPQDED